MKKIILQTPRIPYFKEHKMRNFQYEIRICQKIIIKAQDISALFFQSVVRRLFVDFSQFKRKKKLLIGPKKFVFLVCQLKKKNQPKLSNN